MALSNLIVKISADTKEFVVGTTRVKRDAEGLKSGMKMLSQAITEGSVKLKEMAASGRGASKEYKELKTQVAQARSALRGMGGELSTLKKTADSGFGGRQIADALTGGLIGGGMAGLAIEGAQMLKAAFTDTINVAADFDDQIRKIAATSGATGSEMAKLRDAAIEWGAKTSYSSSEAAQAMQYMAQAGWDTQQMLSGLPGVLNLAASSGEDLAMTADIVTNTLSAFKMEAADSAHLADVLAMAAASSNTNVAKMGDTFRYVGPAAGALGFSIEDTAVAIGLMANSGIKGEQAGTALRAMLTRLADPTRESKMAMQSLGLSLTDASGAVKPLSILLEEMRAGFAKLTPAQQAQTAAQLAGTEAMSGTLALVTASDTAFENLTTQINNATGTAQKMADVMEGGLGGSIRRMQGSWEKFQLSMMEGNGIIQDSADATSSLLDKMSAFVSRGLYFATTAEEAAFMSEKYGNSVLAFAKHSDIAAFQQEQLQKKMAESAASIGKIKEALDKLDWSKMAPPEIKSTAGMPGLAGGQSYQEWAKSQNMMLGATANTRKAISEYIKTLKEQRDEVDMGSEDYKKITAEIAKYEAKLNGATKATKKASETKGLQVSVVSNLMGADEFAMSELTDKMRKQVGEANILKGIFDNIDVLDVEINALSELIKEGVQAGVDPTVLQPYIDKLKELEQMKLGPQINVDEQSLQMSELMAGMATQIANDKRLAEAFGIQFNAIGAEAEALAEVIRAGVESNMDAELLQPLIDKYNQLTEAQQKLTASQQLASDVITGFGQTAASAFEAIGTGSMTAAQGFAAVGKAALGASLDFLKGKLLESVGLQTKFGAKYGPVGVAIAGAGIAALFALVKGAIAKSRAVAFAEGGIVSGPVMGLVGEYAGASRNPEVIAPLDKLQSMLQGSGSTHVTGTFRVQGSDLVLALDNAQRKMSQFRV